MNFLRRDRQKEMQRNRMIFGQAAPNFLDPGLEWRRIFAEMWGTFLLVLTSAGGAVVTAVSGSEITYSMRVAAPGLMVMAIIYFMGTVSGAHLNPAVTLAFAVRRNFPWIRVPAYIAGQLAGASGAIWFLKTLFGTAGNLGATVPGQGISHMTAFAMETVLSAGLINTILGTASGARNIGTNGAIAVGGYIIMAHLWSFPVSGTSMNPARSLASDLLRNDFGTTWIYVAGPLAGAMIGVLFEWILKGPPTEAGTIAAQGTLDLERLEKKGSS
ncbi:MAG: aquaporin [Chlorobiaceae bacterium]|nr:aquaporin [Chlorobiaceae bacterium]